MARLPTQDDFGSRPTPTPTPAVAVARTGAVEESVAEMGRTIEAIGAHVEKARRAAQISEAMGAATEELGLAEIEFQRDQDFVTAPSRFKALARTVGEKHSKGIADPVARGMFERDYLQLATTKHLGVATAAARQEADYHNARLGDTMETLAVANANARTDIERRTILDTARMALGEMKAAGWITDVRAAELEQRFRQKSDQALVMRDMAEDPVAVSEKLKDASYAKSLDPVERERLAHTAVVRKEHNEAQARHAERQRTLQVQEEIIQEFAKGTLTTDKILRSSLPPTGEGSKEHFLNALRARSKENQEQPFRTSPDTYRDLYRRITLPDGDKEKIVDAGPVNEAFLSGKLKPYDRDNLLAAVAHDRTPEGNSLIKDIQTVKTAAHRVFMGHYAASIQPEAYGEASYRFGLELEQRVNEFRKSGKDPRSLLTPGTPDYMLAPGRIKSYMPDARSAASSAAAKAGASQATPPRIADEASYKALPKGATYIDARDGKVKTKGGS